MRIMNYYVRRIQLGSIAQVGCLLGWLVASVPALCSAVLMIQMLREIQHIFEQIRPIELTVLGREVAQIDVLAVLQLEQVAQSASRLTANLPVTFLGVTLLLMAVGAFLVLVVGVLFGIGYNLVAKLGRGLVVELDEHP